METKHATVTSPGAIYWVGSRFSDCYYYEEQLAGSICLYGKTHGKHLALSDTLGSRVDNNVISDSVNDYVREAMFRIAREDPNARFCFYNPGWKYDIGGLDGIEDRLLCINDEKFYSDYGSKIYQRNRFSSLVSMLDACVVGREDCTYARFEELLGPSSDGYILQEDNSSGGTGTLIVDCSNRDTFAEGLNHTEYILTKYWKRNIPVNYHAVIYEDEVLLFPGSVQILRTEKNHLIYKGADYAAYAMIDPAVRKQMRMNVRAVCDVMRQEGYRGVVGLDGMIYSGGKTAFVEINTRFQGSTAALNMGLVQAGFPTIQEFNLESFEVSVPGERALGITDDLPMSCSSYSFHGVYPVDHADLLWRQAEKEKAAVRVDDDGYHVSERVDEDIYRFRMCFNTNICAVNADGALWIHENVEEPAPFIYDKVRALDPLALKITLMTQGVRLTAEAEAYLKENGGIREGNNNAVDVYVRGMVINAPCDVDFIAFTPYTIRLNENSETELYYYENYIDTIKLYPLDPLQGKRTKSGRYYADIAYLSTDRLRVHMTNKCIYKKMGRSCRFCNIDTEDTGALIPMEDIIEVVEDYIANAPEVKHFLVGGQSAEEHSEKTRVVDIIRAIRERSNKNIYVMSLPFSLQTVLEMKEAGMTELACNMEVFDDEIARRIMPGKGKIKRAYYMNVLRYASELFKENKGAVRSALIVGLEEHESFIRGVKALINEGVQPILSVFRPLPRTDLEHLMMPSASYLYEVFLEAEALCREKGMSLGPACINCQNNTLSLPDEIALSYVRA